MSDDDDEATKKLDLDEIFNEIGHLGVYQLVCLILISLTATIASTNAYSLIFVHATPDFRHLRFRLVQIMDELLIGMI